MSPSEGGDRGSAEAEGSGASGGRFDPPRAGRYRFQVTSDGDTETRTLVVSEQKFSPAGEQVSLLRETASGAIQEIYLWRAADVQITQMMGTNDFDSSAALRCNWTPAVTHLKLPLSPTTRWTDTTACGGGPEMERRIETEIQGEASLSTPAGTFDVWTITRRESTTVASRTSAFEITEHFAPRVGLAVKVVQESLDDDGQVRNREVRELESLP